MLIFDSRLYFDQGLSVRHEFIRHAMQPVSRSARAGL
jgi:hypothetical protein